METIVKMMGWSFRNSSDNMWNIRDLFLNIEWAVGLNARCALLPSVDKLS